MIDTDKSGMISKQELQDAISKSSIPLPDAHVKSIIQEVDYFGNDEINYTEFLVATLDAKKLLDEKNLHAIFQNFDTDNSGSITKQNIITALGKMGSEITQGELDEVMRKHDLKHDDQLSFAEFKAMMMDIHDVQQGYEGFTTAG